MALALLACTAGGLGGCVTQETAQLTPPPIDKNERDCLLRAMYFESNRSSYDGLLAVGTVVMNRKESGRYPDTVCGVVGQRNQFASGALTRKLSPRESALAEQAADAVMTGKRHPNMEYVMYFHTAGLHFPYSNMHYRLVAGGNAFYERYPRIPKPQETLVASDAAQQPAAITATAQPTPDATQPRVAVAAPATSVATASVATSSVVAAPQTQTTLAYAATPAAQSAPDPASPLFKLLTNASADQQPPVSTAATTLASASEQPTPAAATTTVSDTAAPMPR